MAQVDSGLSLPVPNEPMILKRGDQEYLNPTWYMFFHQLFEHKEEMEGFEYEQINPGSEAELADVAERLETIEGEVFGKEVTSFDDVTERVSELEAELITIITTTNAGTTTTNINPAVSDVTLSRAIGSIYQNTLTTMKDVRVSLKIE